MPDAMSSSMGGDFRRLVEILVEPEQGAETPAHAHDQAINDGQGEGQIDRESRALAEHGVDVHLAAQLLDIASHHIHAHAAPGNVRDRFRSGKTGGEDEVVNLLVGKSLAGFDDAFLLRLGEELPLGEAVPIVLNLDDDVAPRDGRRAG